MLSQFKQCQTISILAFFLIFLTNNNLSHKPTTLCKVQGFFFLSLLSLILSELLGSGKELGISSLHLLTMLRTAVTSFDVLQNQAFHFGGRGDN